MLKKKKLYKIYKLFANSFRYDAPRHVVFQIPSNGTIYKIHFLVDTGAAVSLIKTHCLGEGTSVNSGKIIEINGISRSKKSIESIGTVQIKLSFFNELIIHDFHMMDSELLNLGYDGILGNDFFESKHAKIDYKNNTLRINDSSIKLHISDPNEHLTPIHTLSPRSETLIQVDILNPEIEEGIVDVEIPIKGVYLAKAITKVDTNNKAYCTILNSTDEFVDINFMRIYLDSIPKNVYHFNKKSNDDSNKRKKLIRDQICTDHLNSEEINSLLDICDEYNSIFYLEGDKLTATDAIKHRIITNTENPVHSKNYRYPEVHKEKVNKQIDKMLEDGIIQPSVSPWSAPIWVVPKKNDSSGKPKWRIVVDYRKLNDVSVGDAFPLPHIIDILDQLGHSRYFTKSCKWISSNSNARR